LITFYILFSDCQVKCEQYWPNRGCESYDVMQVTLVDVIELASYTVRTFQISKVS